MKLILPYPPSANTYWRSIGRGRVILSREARAYKRTVALIHSKVKPLQGYLKLTMSVYRPLKRGDLSNRIKVLEDALNGIAYVDDDQIVEIHALRLDDKENPRVEVEVTEIPINSI